MSFYKQHHSWPSSNNDARSNDLFVRPSAMRIAKMNQENADKKVFSPDFEPEIKRNFFGEPAFIQPQNLIQARSKIGKENDLPEQEADTTVQKYSEKGPETQSKNETGMPADLKSGLENLSGEDLSGVRVHRNSLKPEAINAHAYTQGQDIHLAQGQEKYLPHEGWHVVQQMQGRVQPTIQKKDVLINDDASLEKEADVMGERAVQMKSKGTPIGTNNIQQFSDRSRIIQRAMKFEYQYYDNLLYRDNGKGKVNPLPRKYGPRDYIMKSSSGARLESETRGQIEFETSWEKKWSKLKVQVNAIQNIIRTMNNPTSSPKVKGSDDKWYRKFPYEWALKHLKPNKGFSKSGHNWNRTQKDGKAIVKSSAKDFENFRSTPVYDKIDPNGNFIMKIKNGAKVFFHYYSSNGNWARVKYSGKWGWIWSKSLTEMNDKKYENYSTTDTPLGESEKILMKIGDPTWKAYIQTSESFKLSQFQSYLEQNDGTSASTIIPDTHKFLIDNNPEKAPDGESMFREMSRKWRFSLKHINLKNLLLMVNLYIEQGRNNSTNHAKVGSGGKYVKDAEGKNVVVPGSAKYALHLMSRTHFGSIFNSMGDAEKSLFTKMVLDKENGLMPLMNVKEDDLFFVHGTTQIRQKDGSMRDGYNPKVYDWLVSITKGKDALSSQSGENISGAMGRFNVNEEKNKGKHDDLIRFEARTVNGNLATLEKLDEHAAKQFYASATKRPRETGKGKTGLE